MKNKFIGKSHDKVVMNALAHAKNMGSRTPIKGPCGVESVFEEDEYVTAFDAGGNVVWSYGNGKWRNKPTGAALEWAKRNFGVNADAGEECCCNSVNPIVQNALEYKRACNGKRKLRPGEKLRVGQEVVAMGPHGTVEGFVASVNGDRFKIKFDDGSVYSVVFDNKDIVEVGNSCCENAVNLGMVTLKSPEADEVQKLARTKGYAAAKKYCTEKKAEIEKVDGHRAWYFLDAALDAGKMAGMNSCCENAVPVDGSFTPMAYIKGMIKAIEANPSAKELESGAWKVVRDKPNYKALASTAEYKKLDKMVGINSCGEEDACCNELKEGDAITVKGFMPWDITGKLGKKERNGYWWVFHGNGDKGCFPEKNIIKNDACCNAKFKRNQRVIVKGLSGVAEHGRIERVARDEGNGNVWYEIDYGLGMRGEARERDIKVENSECCNATFREGQHVTIRGIEKEDMPGTIVKKPQSGFPNNWWVSWRDVRTGAERSGVLPEKYLIANAEDMVCNFDPKTRGAQEVIKAIAAIPGGPSNLKRAQALAIQKKVGASDKDFDAALRFFQWDGIADVQNEESVCNAKFKKGDRVVTVSGVHGEVLTVLDDGNYAVQFDGRELSKVPEYRLKAEV